MEPGASLVRRLATALSGSPTIDRFVIGDTEPVATEELRSVSAGYPVTVIGMTIADTCKEVVDGLVRRTVPRETVVDARGPWVFTREALAAALGRVAGRDREIEDPVGLSRVTGLRVHVVVR